MENNRILLPSNSVDLMLGSAIALDASRDLAMETKGSSNIKHRNVFTRYLTSSPDDVIIPNLCTHFTSNRTIEGHFDEAREWEFSLIDTDQDYELGNFEDVSYQYNYEESNSGRCRVQHQSFTDISIDHLNSLVETSASFSAKVVSEIGSFFSSFSSSVISQMVSCIDANNDYNNCEISLQPSPSSPESHEASSTFCRKVENNSQMDYYNENTSVASASTSLHLSLSLDSENLPDSRKLVGHMYSSTRESEIIHSTRNGSTTSDSMNCFSCIHINRKPQGLKNQVNASFSNKKGVARNSFLHSGGLLSLRRTNFKKLKTYLQRNRKLDYDVRMVPLFIGYLSTKSLSLNPVISSKALHLRKSKCEKNIVVKQMNLIDTRNNIKSPGTKRRKPWTYLRTRQEKTTCSALAEGASFSLELSRKQSSTTIYLSPVLVPRQPKEFIDILFIVRDQLWPFLDLASILRLSTTSLSIFRIMEHYTLWRQIFEKYEGGGLNIMDCLEAESEKENRVSLVTRSYKKENDDPNHSYVGAPLNDIGRQSEELSNDAEVFNSIELPQEIQSIPNQEFTQSNYDDFSSTLPNDEGGLNSLVAGSPGEGNSLKGEINSLKGEIMALVPKKSQRASISGLPNISSYKLALLLQLSRVADERVSILHERESLLTDIHNFREELIELIHLNQSQQILPHLEALLGSRPDRRYELHELRRVKKPTAEAIAKRVNRAIQYALVRGKERSKN